MCLGARTQQLFQSTHLRLEMNLSQSHVRANHRLGLQGVIRLALLAIQRTLTFAILRFHLNQPLISWVCCYFSLSSFYFGCSSEPEMGIKVLGKDPDNLHGADTASLLERWKSSWQFLPSQRRGLKAWVCSRATQQQLPTKVAQGGGCQLCLDA